MLIKRHQCHNPTLLQKATKVRNRLRDKLLPKSEGDWDFKTSPMSEADFGTKRHQGQKQTWRQNSTSGQNTIKFRNRFRTKRYQDQKMDRDKTPPMSETDFQNVRSLYFSREVKSNHKDTFKLV